MLLRCYPPAWRARYGDELVALMEDSAGPSGSLPLTSRLGIARAGVAERLRGLGSNGDRGVDERLRSGSVLVLTGWALFVVAGAGFAKLSEHWDQLTPAADRAVPQAAYDVVQAAAALGAAVLAMAALAALPSFVRRLRSGGWTELRGPVVTAVAACVLAVAATGAAVLVAHGASSTPTSGVPVLGVAWASLAVASLVVTTACVATATRRLDLPSAVLRLEAALAVALTVVMVLVLAGVLVWWAAIATDAAGFLSQAGLFRTQGPPSLAVAAVLMVLGLALALWGDGRMVRAARRPG